MYFHNREKKKMTFNILYFKQIDELEWTLRCFAAIIAKLLLIFVTDCNKMKIVEMALSAE